MQRRVSYVEDDAAILANYTEILRDEGFDVTPIASKDEAIQSFQETLPDLVLLDVSLHGERDAGFQICTELRRLSDDVPIIFLTSHSAEFDKISGLRLGADDYITKDASIDYIVVRIETLLRRVEAIRGANEVTAQADEIILGDLRLDEVFSRAYWRADDLHLSLTHYWILKELCAQPGQVKSHRDLMNACSIVVEDNTITAHIRALRNAFTAVDAGFDCIKTERGLGYRWVTP